MDAHKNRQILLIDDDEPLRGLVTEYLKGYGFTVNTLPDGIRAVETVTACPPDLIILDVMMPGPDGFEVLQKLRPEYANDAHELTAASQVIALNFQTVAAANNYWRKG